MKLAQRLLLGSFLVVAVLVVFVVAVIDQRLHVRMADESTRELGRQARLVATQWTSAMADADALADLAGAALGNRVTLIDSAGRVVGDSEFDGPALARLENHGTRPEVRLVRDGAGVGSARRRSASAGNEELYVAVPAPLGVARVSITTRAMEEIFDGAQRDVFFAGFVALLAATALAWAFSLSVSRPIVELRDVARAFAAGDLTRRPSLSAPGEVGDLATALYRLAEQLSSRLEAHEAEESLLAELFDSLNEGAVAVDARHMVVRINHVGRTLLGTRDAEPFPVSRLPHDDTLRESLDAALAGRATEPVEIAVAGRTLLLTARPLADGGAVIALFDLTPLRRLETVRRDFVANVSHELRTPLTIISGFAETLDDDDVDAEQRRHFIRTIRSNATRMQRIVDDLLDLSRIESGGWVPNPSVSDVLTTAREVIAASRPAAEANRVELDVAIADDARHVDADPTALRQVLTNLVENAVRHTQHGRITVFTEPDAAGLWIGVRDTGIGIPAEHLPRIFERFYRVDASRSREVGGTGLGLAIVRHLVEAHGGRVRAESTVGVGTTIAVHFPA